MCPNRTTLWLCIPAVCHYGIVGVSATMTPVATMINTPLKIYIYICTVFRSHYVSVVVEFDAGHFSLWQSWNWSNASPYRDSCIGLCAIAFIGRVYTLYIILLNRVKVNRALAVMIDSKEFVGWKCWRFNHNIS